MRSLTKSSLPPEKVCTLCRRSKSLHEFYRRGSSTQTWCKSCMNAYQAVYRRTPDKVYEWIAQMRREAA